MLTFFSIIVGGLLGWVASLLNRTPTSGGILLDICTGAVGALAGAILFGRDYMFDAVSASYLGAILLLLLLLLLRRLFGRNRPQVEAELR